MHQQQQPRQHHKNKHTHVPLDENREAGDPKTWSAEAIKMIIVNHKSCTCRAAEHNPID